MKRKKYRTIDLCAGIGGIRKGFELTGRFKNVLSAEIDKHACATYKELFREDPNNDLTGDDFKEKVSKEEYDILLAGFPCQTFSKAGLQQGFRDTTKGTIFFDIADIISRTRPSAIFLENVENLVSHDQGRTMERIINTLEQELDYHVIGVAVENGKYTYSRKSFVRNSRYFGLPQNRPRTYIMAFNRKKYGNVIDYLPCDLPTKGSAVIAEDLNDILEINVDDEYYMSKQYLNTLKKHRKREHEKGNGFGYVVVNSDGIEHPIANTILATGGSGKERNLIVQHKDGVAGKKLASKRSPLNDEDIRVMTPTEWGKLQGFIGYAFIDNNGTDRFRFPDATSKAQQYKQFGNSVTIPVIEEMAKFMLLCFSVLEDDNVARVISLAKHNDTISKNDIVTNLSISNMSAYSLITKMEKASILEPVIKRGPGAAYKLSSRLNNNN